MKPRLPLTALALAACVPVPHPEPAAGRPKFDALSFFDGETHGNGTLRIAFHAPRPVTVEGRGHIEPDGTLVLDQTVTEGAKPPTHRQWRIHSVGSGHYAGTLSDAAGAIVGETEGNRLSLRFPMKGGLAAVQRLTLAPDGGSAHNIMTISKLGIRVAVLDETICKTGRRG